MRVLAIDWGSVRVGLAVSDPDGKIAFPLNKPLENKNAIDEIKKIITDLSIEKILIGVPVALSGKDTKSTEKVAEFITHLKSQITQPIEQLDERFSSVAAIRALNEQGVSAKNQRIIKDNVAAQLMLQQYLDTNINKN